MDYIVNWGLLRQPINWLVIWSMLLIWWLLFEAIERRTTATPDNL